MQNKKCGRIILQIVKNSDKLKKTGLIMGRKKVLFTINLIVLAFLGVFGLLLQAKENRKIMSIEIKTENELNEMKKGLVPSDEFMGNLIFFGEKSCLMMEITVFIIYLNRLVLKNTLESWKQ